jgi:hypothetical protein
MNQVIEDQLKDELRQRADGLPARPDPYTLVRGRIVRSARRRTGAIVVCAVVLLVTAVLAVPGLLDLGKHNAVVNPPSPRVDGSAGSPMRWPTRGSLAGDAEYVRRAAGWLAERASTQPGEINVLYAGDVAGKRLAVGAYQRTGKAQPVEIVSLAGPAGSDQELKESPAPWFRGPEFDHLVAFLVPAEAGKRDQRTTVVVLPDSSVQALTYSRHPTVPPSGAGVRTWAALTDGDDEPGVVTGRIDGAVAPGALRIGATLADGLGAHPSQAADFTGMDTHPRTALREMAEQAAGDKFIEELAPALQMLELSNLGREQITSVRIPWRFDRDGEWVGLRIGLAGGGVVEAVLSTSHPLTFEGTGIAQETVIYAVRAVEADQAGKVPFLWRPTNEDGEDSCQVYGYVPDQLAATENTGARVATASATVDGERSMRSSVANGQPLTMDYCPLLSKAERGSPPSPIVRLLDQADKKLWQGVAEERYTVTPDSWLE